jgi:D-alanine-D-alanine ligase
MKLVILHDAQREGASKDERDNLVQVNAVSRALEELGHEVICLPSTWNLPVLKGNLLEISPDLVFNLIESLQGEGNFIHIIPTLLDALGIPYTGCSAESLYLTSNKIAAKRMLRLAGILTPDWITVNGLDPQACGEDEEQSGFTYILKAIWEHSSAGIDEESVVEGKNHREIRSILERRNRISVNSFFAERYIDGREFNLSIMMDNGKARVLPPAEMKFSQNDTGRPKVISYAAKWDEGSLEYASTNRCLDFNEYDQPILQTLAKLSLRCWSLFGLNGYARVDFRVDSTGAPYVLEINANPCISPDSGFVAAATRAGIYYNEMIRMIIDHPLMHFR